MRAAVLESNGRIVCREADRPSPGPGSVLVKVAYCGICGSDIPRVYDNTARYYPIILGHEFSGTIEELGEGVDGIEVGSKAVGVPLIPCMRCDDCRNGNYSACRDYSFIGSRRNGAMAEYVEVPKENIIVLPDGFDLRAAAMIEPATVAYHALLMCGDIKGKDVAVIGCGIIGIFTIILAKVMGAGHVTAIGRGIEGLDAAEIAGADQVITSDGCTDRSFGLVIECSGSDATMHKAIEIAGVRGTVCYIGTPKKEITFTVRQWEQINRKECTVKGSWMSYSGDFPGREWKDIIRMMDDGKIELSRISCYSIESLEKVNDIFEDIHTGITKGRKLLEIR